MACYGPFGAQGRIYMAPNTGDYLETILEEIPRYSTLRYLIEKFNNNDIIQNK